MYLLCFFFNDTATTEIYPLSLHDALPISSNVPSARANTQPSLWIAASMRASSSDVATTSRASGDAAPIACWRSEEHTTELQSHSDLVCRLLLEKKNYDATSIVKRLLALSV